MQQKKIPMRMCIGCNQMRSKKELVRVVRSPEGNISLDHTGKKPGRGAYLCNNPECLKKARKSRRLERAFHGAIPDEIFEMLEGELTHGK
ncbi:MAG TPA: DUF448 domain-containing protein [Ruminococcaceae bacterium]|nr:DUF448 domain-containing protein [Oscillospiraceae bacterium]